MKKIKFNILDISILLIIIVLILAAFFKFKNYNAGENGNAASQTIEYSIIIKNTREYTTDAIESGDVVYDSQTGVEIGRIIEKQIINSTEYEKIETGEYVKTQIPNRYDLILTIETPGIINENGYYANKSVEIKVGSDKKISTLYVETNGKITGVEEKIKNTI